MRLLGQAARLLALGFVMGASVLSMFNPYGPAGLLALPYALVGAILVIRRPRTSIGWLLLGVGLCFALISVPVTATAQEFADGSVDPADALFTAFHTGLGTTAFLLIATLVMVFPSGRLPAGGWGRLGRVALGAGLLFAIAAYLLPEIPVGAAGSAWVPNPIALFPNLSIWQVITPTTVFFPVMAVVVAGAVSMVVRATRATGIERQQLRWIAASFAVLTAAVVSGIVLASLVPAAGDGAAWIPAMAAFPTVPIAIGIAVLRYRLYEIDRIISRTIGYAVVTAVLAAVFLGTNLVLQTWVSGLTGGSTVAVAVTTLLAAALFQPLRRVTQAPIDRRFNRARVDSERTLAAFGDRVRDEVQLARLSRVVVATADEAVRPTTAGLWLRGSGG